MLGKVFFFFSSQILKWHLFTNFVFKSKLTHKVLREPAPGAPVDEHAPVAVDVRHVHGRALHFRIGEPHLQVQVVHVPEELAEVPSGGPDGRVVAQVAEEPHETLAEVPHEGVGRRRRRAATAATDSAAVVFGHDPGVVQQLGRSGRQLRHQPVRIYVVCVEHVPLAPGQPDDFAPRFFAVLQLFAQTNKPTNG